MVTNMFALITAPLMLVFQNKSMEIAFWVAILINATSFIVSGIFLFIIYSKVSKKIFPSKYHLMALVVLNILHDSKDYSITLPELKKKLRDKLSETKIDIIMQHLVSTDLVSEKYLEIQGEQTDIISYALTFKSLTLFDKK